MNILHVTPAFHPAKGYGGGPSVAYQICRHLAGRGHAVTVFTTDADDAHGRLAARGIPPAGMDVRYFANISNRMAYRWKLFLPPRMIPALRAIRAKLDVVHIHDLRTVQAAAAYILIRQRVPYILQAHGVIPNTTGSLGWAKKIFDGLWGRRIVRDADGLIALSGDEADEYVRLGAAREKIRILPNGLDLTAYRHLPGKGCFRKRVGLRRQKLILYLGRIHNSKRIDLLIESFALLAGKLPDARLVIAGPDDGFLAAAREMAVNLGIGGRVLFPGYLEGNDKLAAYVDADVFVTPRFTGFPLTFLEAMASGLPVITTELGDSIEGIKGHAGLITRGQAGGLCEGMRRMLADRQLRSRLSAGARKFVRRFDWDAVGSQYERIYREVRRPTP
jgi:glycosyltransferase involved in cell wall biosynthesis